MMGLGLRWYDGFLLLPSMLWSMVIDSTGFERFLMVCVLALVSQTLWLGFQEAPVAAAVGCVCAE